MMRSSQSSLSIANIFPDVAWLCDLLGRYVTHLVNSMTLPWLLLSRAPSRVLVASWLLTVQFSRKKKERKKVMRL